MQVILLVLLSKKFRKNSFAIKLFFKFESVDTIAKQRKQKKDYYGVIKIENGFKPAASLSCPQMPINKGPMKKGSARQFSWLQSAVLVPYKRIRWYI